MYFCRKLTISQADEIYRKMMKKDFPRSELKPLSMIHKGLARKEYLCFGFFDDEDTVCGYAYFVFRIQDGQRVYMLDYFAVAENMRGTGLGSQFIKMACEEVNDADYIICEAEAPEKASDEDDRLTRTRRVDFYLRNGFRDTGVTAFVFGVVFKILEFGAEHTEDEMKKAYSELYRSFLPEILYRACFKTM